MLQSKQLIEPAPAANRLHLHVQSHIKLSWNRFAWGQEAD
jgi:hypothetical protein